MKTLLLSTQLYQHIELLMRRYPILQPIEDDIIDAYLLMEACYTKNAKLLIAGNGGSAADAEHIVGELMKSFRLPRIPDRELSKELIAVDAVRGKELTEKLQGSLSAIALQNHAALNTAFLNDVDGLFCYAQQVYGYGNEGDVFLGISTSGNSKNIVNAAIVAKAKKMKVIGLTGIQGGQLAEISDVAVKAPETETYMIQELHLPIYHCWCLMLEERFFGITSRMMCEANRNV